jgi:hypothetical protein
MFASKKNSSDHYTLKLRELNHIHHLALEQYKKSYPKFKSDPENKFYNDEFNRNKSNLKKVDAKLFLLESEVKKSIKQQDETIKKADTKINRQKKLNEVLTDLSVSQTDKDKALIEMADDLKESQSDRLMYLFDMGLGISLLGLFIYKKTRSQ